MLVSYEKCNAWLLYLLPTAFGSKLYPSPAITYQATLCTKMPQKHGIEVTCVFVAVLGYATLGVLHGSAADLMGISAHKCIWVKVALPDAQPHSMQLSVPGMPQEDCSEVINVFEIVRVL